MPHPLEDEYNLTARELLDMINERFRLKVALTGAVAEVQFGKRLATLQETGVISRYEHHDVDNYPDFTIWVSEEGPELKVEVKNARDYKAAYREGGEVTRERALDIDLAAQRAVLIDFPSREHPPPVA